MGVHNISVPENKFVPEAQTPQRNLVLGNGNFPLPKHQVCSENIVFFH